MNNMTEQTSLPFGIPPKRYPTPAMIYTLKKHKRYRKGIEFDEARAIIEKIAEGEEPRELPSLAYLMAKHKYEKQMMEQKVEAHRKLVLEKTQVNK
jgi:hypothetical protein